MKKFYLGLFVLLGSLAGCTEEAETPVLEIEPNTDIQFDSEGGQKTITVKTNQEKWDVVSNQDWCIVSAEDEGHFTVSAAENTEAEARPEATVSVTAGNLKVTMKVNQSASGSTEPEPQASFEISLSEPTSSGISMTVVPSDNDILYYYDVLEKAILTEHHSSDLKVYMKNMMEEAIKNFGSAETAVQTLCTKGKTEYEFTKLSPDADYVAFAAGVDQKGNVITEIPSKEFRTLALSESVNFEVKFSEMTYDGANISVTPSDNELPYYVTVRNAQAYKNMDNKALLEAIIGEDGAMLDFYAMPGKQELTKADFPCFADTEYLVLIFGWANGAATTDIYKFPYRTSKPDKDPALCTYAITSSDIKPRSFKIDIVPSDATVPYMYDILSAEEYGQYKTDLKGYVEKYVSQAGDLESARVHGESGFLYNNGIQPATEYYVWAASIDEMGKVQGEVRISEPVRTLDAVVSKAVCSGEVDKYFNGDELAALDPKYADYKGSAYVSVSFTQQDSKVWYGTIIKEDPNDHTDKVSDAEIIETLTAAGVQFPTTKLYLCDWDAEYTILAVGTDEVGNFGKVFRKHVTFTKEGASPATEFVDPETQQ